MAGGKEGAAELIVLGLLAALIMVLAVPMLSALGPASEQSAPDARSNAQRQESFEIAPN